MTQSNTDFTQTPADPVSITIRRKEKDVAAAQPGTELASNQHCDILLSNFQIKKNRYRVLLNYDHIVWERLKSKSGTSANAECHLKKAEYESEQLSRCRVYGSNTNMLHINELIRVSKGNTKAAALYIAAPQPNAEFGAHATSEQQQQQASTTPPTEQYLALSYAARIVNSATDCNRWEVRNLVLYSADAYIVRQWHGLLNKMLTNIEPPRLRIRRLLVFINPFGGRKKGLHVYDRYCKPLFQLAGIDVSCIISQRSNQIRDILLSHDLTPFDAVCCVGGDGTVAEVINGLIFRAICDASLDTRQPAYVPKPALPIGIIPAGSTDTVAYSLHGTADVRTAAIHLILGQRRGMDICSVRNREGIIRFCASVLSYGYLGDVAAKSERYRWMGTKRYEFTGVKTFLTNNGYEAELRVLQPISETNATTDESSVSSRNSAESAFETKDAICCANCTRCNAAAVEQAELAAKPTMMKKAILADASNTAIVDDELPSSSNASLKSCEDNGNAFASVQYKKEDVTEGGVFSELPRKTLRSSNDDVIDFDNIRNIDLMNCDKSSAATHVPANYNGEEYTTPANDVSSTANVSMQGTPWKTINGKFFMISGANITCACTRSPNGVARYSHIGDGYLDLILVRKTSLLNNIRLLINLMGNNGDIRNLPFVETYRTKKFCFRSPNANLMEEYSIKGSCQPIAAAAECYDDDDNFSRWNCDGEVVTDQELTLISHCQLIDVFMRGPHTYKKPLKSDKSCSLLCCCCGCCRSDD